MLLAAIKTLLALPFIIIYYVLESLVKSLIPKSLRYKNVDSETVLITGAGSGIGRELAKRFAKFGARLVLLDIDESSLRKTASLIDKPKNSVSLYQCDVSKKDAVYAVSERIKHEVGAVTILVNNAGIVTGKKFLDCPDDRLQKTMEVNIMAHFWTCKAFLPAMMATNHGHIVSVASLAGYGVSTKVSDYCASKFAAVGFAESLRMELEKDGFTGVKITIVAPYLVNTGLFEGFRAEIHDGLSTDWVADEIMSAVLTNQEVAILPSIFKIAIMLGAILPGPATRKLYDVSGLSTSMDDFQGRKNN